jgi:molybdopterin molybdotransferase
MLSFDAALERVLAAVDGPPRSDRVSLENALGRVLGETLIADSPLPPFAYSAMDGYAVRAADLATERRLPVVGESRTGRLAPELASGSACRIFTGAALPAGADAIVMQEDVERDGDFARFRVVPEAGAHVRQAGEDLAPGQVALSIGTRLGPTQLGLCAALDRATLTVASLPRVSIVCTGDELRAPGSRPRPGSIPESNGVALAALTRLAGGAPRLTALTGDDRESTTRAVADAAQASDLLITVGGVSVGDHDVVRPALEQAGAHLDFWKVRIKPGKPLVFGRAGSTLILGLPGNPVSAQVTFMLFGIPVLRKLQGDSSPAPRLRQGRLTEALRQKPGRRGYYRARLDGDALTPISNQASGAVTGMAWANCLAIVEEDSEGAEAGQRLDVLAFADL